MLSHFLWNLPYKWHIANYHLKRQKRKLFFVGFVRLKFKWENRRACSAVILTVGIASIRFSGAGAGPLFSPIWFKNFNETIKIQFVLCFFDPEKKKTTKKFSFTCVRNVSISVALTNVPPLGFWNNLKEMKYRSNENFHQEFTWEMLEVLKLLCPLNLQLIVPWSFEEMLSNLNFHFDSFRMMFGQHQDQNHWQISSYFQMEMFDDKLLHQLNVDLLNSLFQIHF